MSVSMSVPINHFYSCALQLYSLHREVHSENVFLADIFTKNVIVNCKYAFYGFHGAFGVWVVCEPVFSTAVYIAVQGNIARSAFCAACSVPRNIT